MKYSRLIPLAILACAMSAAVAAEPPGSVRVDLVLAQGGMTLDQAVEQVRRQYNGRIVSAETRVNGNRETHYIRVLMEDGTVRTITVPGRTLGNG
jgi:hypothetical protein